MVTYIWGSACQFFFRVPNSPSLETVAMTTALSAVYKAQEKVFYNNFLFTTNKKIHASSIFGGQQSVPFACTRVMQQFLWRLKKVRLASWAMGTLEVANNHETLFTLKIHRRWFSTGSSMSSATINQKKTTRIM